MYLAYAVAGPDSLGPLGNFQDLAMQISWAKFWLIGGHVVAGSITDVAFPAKVRINESGLPALTRL